MTTTKHICKTTCGHRATQSTEKWKSMVRFCSEKCEIDGYLAAAQMSVPYILYVITIIGIFADQPGSTNVRARAQGILWIYDSTRCVLSAHLNLLVSQLSGGDEAVVVCASTYHSCVHVHTQHKRTYRWGARGGQHYTCQKLNNKEENTFNWELSCFSFLFHLRARFFVFVDAVVGPFTILSTLFREMQNFCHFSQTRFF